MNLADLPQEILLHVLSHMSPKQLCRIKLVSNYLHILCTDNQLWKTLLSNIYDLHYGSDCIYYDEFRMIDLKYKLKPQQICALNKINLYFPHILPRLMLTDTYVVSLNAVPLAHIIISLRQYNEPPFSSLLQVHPYSSFYNTVIHNNCKYIVTTGVFTDITSGIRNLVIDNQLHDAGRSYYSHIMEDTYNKLCEEGFFQESPDSIIVYLDKPQLKALGYLMDRCN